MTEGRWVKGIWIPNKYEAPMNSETAKIRTGWIVIGLLWLAVVAGFIAMSGCVKRPVPISAVPLVHEYHIPECWHNREYRCELDTVTMNFLQVNVGSDSYHCRYIRCKVCGRWLAR